MSHYNTAAWVALAAFGALASLSAPAGAARQDRQESAALVTPPGVTIQTISGGRGPSKFLFGDAKGMTLYTTDKDTEANKSSCYAECAQAWPPFIAAKDAKPFAEWSFIVRDDGAKQWAYKGKPLYTFAKDKAIGDTTGVTPPGGMGGAGAGGGGPNAAAAAAARAAAAAAAPAAPTEPNPWHIADYLMAADMPVPFGLMVREAPDANGLVLADMNEMTLYTFDGDPNRDKPSSCKATPCASPWTPVWTAQIAKPVGDFTLISRKDGLRQWAYKGKALYSFDGDLSIGDANGIGVDKQWQPALLKQYFIPAQARIHTTVSRGKILTTAEGMTLYRRNSYNFQVSGHALPRGVAITPAVGRAIGARTCEGECLKTWTPFTAAPDAQPSGFWEIVTGADGSRQWTYKGYALYRFAGDTKPGDVNGLEHYDIFTNVSMQKPTNGASAVAAAMQMRSINQTSLFWSDMYP